MDMFSSRQGFGRQVDFPVQFVQMYRFHQTSVQVRNNWNMIWTNASDVSCRYQTFFTPPICQHTFAAIMVFQRPNSCSTCPFKVLKVGVGRSFLRTAKPFTVSAKVSTSPWAHGPETQLMLSISPLCICTQRFEHIIFEHQYRWKHVGSKYIGSIQSIWRKLIVIVIETWLFLFLMYTIQTIHNIDWYMICASLHSMIYLIYTVYIHMMFVWILDLFLIYDVHLYGFSYI